jgi:hypothetical protein
VCVHRIEEFSFLIFFVADVNRMMNSHTKYIDLYLALKLNKIKVLTTYEEQKRFHFVQDKGYSIYFLSVKKILFIEPVSTYCATLQVEINEPQHQFPIRVHS